MKKVFDSLKPFRVFIVLILAALAAYLGFRYFSSSDSEPRVAVGIEAVNDVEYASIDQMEEEDFKVYLVYDDDSTELLNENIEVDFDSAKPVGETAFVNVSYTEYAVSETEESTHDETETVDSETVLNVYTCEAEVHVKREKVLGISCGYPNAEDVTAVAYSNGELCFEGEGDILVYDEGDAPWLSIEDVTIKAVSFSEGVSPTNLNYCFEGMSSLTYCETIPSSVITMIRTFYDCEGLTEAADWTECPSLLIATECYAGCANLKTLSPIPENMKVAERAFQDCVSLSATADMTYAISLTDAAGMYSGCQSLVEIQMCPNVVDMSEMFEDCINLKNMPFIPSSTLNMDSAFSGDVSLLILTSIPAGVESMSQAFYDCQMIQGDFPIDAVCEDSNYMFSGAALATKVNLTGSSEMLHVYANTCESGNITVNGQSADASLASYNDVVRAEESRAAEESERAEQESIKAEEESEQETSKEKKNKSKSGE